MNLNFKNTKALIITLLFSFATMVFASEETHEQSVGYGLFFPLILGAFAYFNKHRAIGGWLLFFYIQMYLGLLTTLILLFGFGTISRLEPSNWNDSVDFGIALLRNILVFATTLAEAIVASILLFKRSGAILNILRWTLVGLTGTYVIAILIDLTHFNNLPAIKLDIVNTGIAVSWAIYFRFSSRVRDVFINKDWQYVGL